MLGGVTAQREFERGSDRAVLMNGRYAAAGNNIMLNLSDLMEYRINLHWHPKKPSVVWLSRTRL